MYRDWLIKYDYFLRLIVPFFLATVLSVIFTTYGAQHIYLGYYLLEGWVLVSLGIICLFLAIFCLLFAVGYRTIFTRVSITRKVFWKVKKSYKWKELAQVHLITRKGNSYFYFSLEKMPPEAMLLTRGEQEFFYCTADDEIKNLVQRFYRRNILHFFTKRNLRNKFSRKINGNRKIIKNKFLKKSFFIYLISFLFILILFILFRGLFERQQFAMIILGLLALFLIFLPSACIKSFVFNENGCYIRRLFVTCSINKFEVKSYGIYTDKDKLGSAIGKYVFVSKFKMSTHEVQYNASKQANYNRAFLICEYDDDIFELLKDIVVLEPQRVAKQFY